MDSKIFGPAKPLPLRVAIASPSDKPGRAITPVPAASCRPSSSSFLTSYSRYNDTKGIVSHITKTGPHSWWSLLSPPVEVAFANRSVDLLGSRAWTWFLDLGGVQYGCNVFHNILGTEI